MTIEASDSLVLVPSCFYFLYVAWHIDYCHIVNNNISYYSSHNFNHSPLQVFLPLAKLIVLMFVSEFDTDRVV